MPKDTEKYGNLYNPKGPRNLSDRLDQAVGWHGAYKESSGTRGFIHGVWHSGACLGAAVTGGNAAGECKRARDQFSKMLD